MNKKLTALIFTLLGTIILLINIVIVLPIRGYLLVYGVQSLSLLDIVSVMGDGWQGIVMILPWISLAILLLGIAFLGIFFHKKRGYGLLLFISRLSSFVAILLVVLKTYAYMAEYPISAMAGTVLVIGGFLSWYSCFWGYSKKKLLSTRIPMTIWIASFLLFGALISFLPSEASKITYTIASGGIEAIVYTPRGLDSKEIIFALIFLANIWISSLCFHTIVYGYEGTTFVGPKYRKRGVAITLFFLVLGIGGVWIKEALFTPPVYESGKYDSILVKEGYQPEIPNKKNGYYLQNQWLLSHTGFLQTIENHPFVKQNYMSQSGFLLSGFSQFWKSYSGQFLAEFSGFQAIIQMPYAMMDKEGTVEEHIGYPDDKIRERTILLNTIAIGLCKTQQCETGFLYRKERHKFLEMRLKSSPALIQSLISLVSIKKSLSGAQELLPYLVPSQKQELKLLMLPYDIAVLHKNMLVGEYYFTHLVGIKNLQDHMELEKTSIPKFLLDLEYTDFLMKESFAKAIAGEKMRTERPTGFVYNSKGYLILIALLPRISSIYTNLTDLEAQKASLARKLQ